MTKIQISNFCKKTDIILGAASYVGAPFKNYPFADIIKNIKDVLYILIYTYLKLLQLYSFTN